MKIPIINVKTKDKLDLYGLLLEAPKKKAVIINIHGTADNFYDNDFIWEIYKSLTPLGISMLSTNNRGAYGLEVYQSSGACTEIFEKCLIDIDAWIEKALALGYKKIILQGHSLGTEKLVYYLNKGKYRNKIEAVILLGFSDSYGTHNADSQKIKDTLMKEARKLVKARQGNFFLTSTWRAHAGVLPQNAQSYINFFKDKSELSQAFPLRQGANLSFYQKIKVPILGVIGDQEEYTIIPVKKAVSLLEKENKLAQVFQIKNCNHCFEGREKELAKIVKRFILKYV